MGLLYYWRHILTHQCSGVTFDCMMQHIVQIYNMFGNLTKHISFPKYLIDYYKLGMMYYLLQIFSKNVFVIRFLTKIGRPF